MSNDRVRTDAYDRAIGRALRRLGPGARVLDIGAGPFMLLGRMAHHSGAAFVACVEHSASAVQLCTELARREWLTSPTAACDWRIRPDEPRDFHNHGGGGHGSGSYGGGSGGGGGGSGGSSRPASIHHVPERDVLEAERLMRRLSLELTPTALSFRAVGGAAAPPPTPGIHKADTAGDGLTRPLMQLASLADGAEEAPGRAGGTRAARHREPPRLIELYHGMSSEIALPSRIDLIVHEILGNIASAEGAIAAVNELRQRRGLAAEACRVLPAAAATLLVPTSRLVPCVVERLLMFQRTGGWHAKPGQMYSGESVDADRRAQT